MFNQYSKLFWQLNSLRQEHLDEDLSLLESAMCELVDSWTDYMMSRTEAPTDEESEMYHKALDLTLKF